MGVGRCKNHGGTLPGSVRGGQRKLREREARTYLEKYGVLGPITNPVAKLAEIAAEVDALRAYFQHRVEQLRDEDFTSLSVLGVDQINSLVAAYERALDRCVKVLTDMARLGIEERLTRASEAEVMALGASLDRVLADPSVGLDAAQRSRILALLAEELDPQ